MSELNKDIFTVSIPWGIDPSIQVNELELPIVLLQQNIIDSLQEENTALKEKCKRAEDGSDWKDQYLAAREKNAELVANFDRAVEATEVVRRDRARYIEKLEQTSSELNRITKELGNLKKEHASALRIIEQQKAEIAGFPRLTENKIKAALAAAPKLTEDTERLKAELAKTKEKNVNLNDRVNALTIKANAVSSLSDLMGRVIKESNELSRAYNKGQQALDESLATSLAYINHLTEENLNLKSNAFYLSSLAEYNEMRAIYESGPWKVVLFSDAKVMAKRDRKLKEHEMPMTNFGVTMAINQETGFGHFAYINIKGELTFPEDIDNELLVPKELHGELKDAIESVDLKSFAEAVDDMNKRNGAVADAIAYLNNEWIKHPETFDLTTAIFEKVGLTEIRNLEKKVKSVRALVPRLAKDIEAINKQFGCDIPLPALNEKAAKKAAKKASKSKRKKRR